MISKAYINSLTNAKTYSKGLDLYKKQRVMELDVVEEDNDLDIEAMVKGSGHNVYEVYFSYDSGIDEILDPFCECPAFRQYPGLCKHCVAVMLEFNDYLSEYEYEGGGILLEDDLDTSQDIEAMTQMWLSQPSHREARKPKVKQETTPFIKELLLKSVSNNVPDPVFYGSTGDLVKLEPELRCFPSGIELEFKIGTNRMYVVKDIRELYLDIQSENQKYYGKHLDFKHRRDVFDAKSQKYIDFIGHHLRNTYHQSRYYGYSHRAMRTMTLSPEELDDFLDCAKDTSLAMNILGHEESLWQVKDEPVPRNMTISKATSGIRVTINYLDGYVGRKHYIYFIEGKIYRVAMEDIAPIRDFLSCMGRLPSRSIFIEDADVPVFVRDLLPVLKDHYEITYDGFDEEAYNIPEAKFEFYLDAPDKNTITCEVRVKYGEKIENLYNLSRDSIQRDALKENLVNEKVSPFFNTLEAGNEILAIHDDEDKLYEVLTYGLDTMETLGHVYGSDALKRITVKKKSKIALGVSVESDLMSITIDSGDLSSSELNEILSRYNPKKKYHRLKNGDFIQMENDDLQTLYELKEGLHLTDEQMKSGQLDVPKYRALYVDEVLKKDQSLSLDRDKSYRSLIRNMKTIEDNDFEVPGSLKDVLRTYQKSGFLWMKTLSLNGFGGILADDMGLGKTLQVIAFILSEKMEAKEAGKTLIVCPASLVYNWQAEFEKFAPQLKTTLVLGTAKERKDIIDAFEADEIVITSYDLLKRDIDHYREHCFHAQVIDEAQAIKNQTTKAAKAVKAIKAEFRLALTGTPIENRLSELWSVFDYLMPGFLFSYTKFKKEIESPVIKSGDEKSMDRLRKLITPFILRRLKADVLTDLPDKIEENMPVSMAPEQKSLYDAHVQRIKNMLSGQSDQDFTKSKIQILSELTRLRQLCCDPALIYADYKTPSAKVETCLELIREAVEGGHKVLLFSQFTSMLDIIRKNLNKDNIAYHYLSGATNKKKRAQMVEDFNTDDTSVFCISLKAGGTGLNLTAADIVIHFDPWWNVAVQNQATDRAHRIGQKNVVNVYRLIAKDSIEEKIVKLQDKKKALAEEILSGEGMGVGQFSKEELLELLG